MLDALKRREEYEAELEAMTPEQRAENDARLDRLKALIPQQTAPAIPGILTVSMAAEKHSGLALFSIAPKLSNSLKGGTPAAPQCWLSL